MGPQGHVPAPPPAYAPAVPTMPPVSTARVVDTETGTGPDRESLAWGPIWAGVLGALGLFVLMTLLAIAVGLQAAPTAEEVDVGLTASIVTSVIALVAFFIGGFVSAWSANVSDPGRALLNGFLVWSLFLVLVFLLAAFGLGSALGAASGLFDQLRLGPTGVDIDPGQAVQVIRDAAWQSLLALGLTAAAATLGGVIGARDEVRTFRTMRVGSSRG